MIVRCGWCHRTTTLLEATMRNFRTGLCAHCAGPLVEVSAGYCCQAGYEASPDPCPWHGQGNVTHTRDGF